MELHEKLGISSLVFAEMAEALCKPPYFVCLDNCGPLWQKVRPVQDRYIREIVEVVASHGTGDLGYHRVSKNVSYYIYRVDRYADSLALEAVV